MYVIFHNEITKKKVLNSKIKPIREINMITSNTLIILGTAQATLAFILFIAFSFHVRRLWRITTSVNQQSINCQCIGVVGFCALAFGAVTVLALLVYLIGTPSQRVKYMIFSYVWGTFFIIASLNVTGSKLRITAAVMTILIIGLGIAIPLVKIDDNSKEETATLL